MTRTIFIYGAVSGLIVIASMILGMVMNRDGFFGSQVFGYLIMLVALSCIFFGVKSHRDKDRGGYIKFLPAFFMGLGIAAVAGVAYVAAWEVFLVATDYAFMTEYADSVIAQKEADGASAAEIAETREKLETMMAHYANPLFRLPITFSEIFPVGLLVSLVSAALLRKPEVLPAR